MEPEVLQQKLDRRNATLATMRGLGATNGDAAVKELRQEIGNLQKELAAAERRRTLRIGAQVLEGQQTKPAGGGSQPSPAPSPQVTPSGSTPAPVPHTLCAKRLTEAEQQQRAAGSGTGIAVLGGLGSGVGLAGAAAAASPDIVVAAAAAAAPQLSALVTATAVSSAAPVVAVAGAAVAAMSLATAAYAASGAPPAAAEHWVKDADRTCCRDCGVQFGTYTRRHHCRGCGEVLCHDCAPALPKSGGQRVCKQCSLAITSESSLACEPMRATDDTSDDTE